MNTPLSHTQPPPSSVFATYAPRYLDMGLSVLPIAPNGKAPGEYSYKRWHPASGWQKYCDRLPNKYEMSVWEHWPDAGVGVALGAASAPKGLILIAVDIDTDRADVTRAIMSVLPPSPVRKRGRVGQTIFYLAPPEVVSKSYNDGNKSRILDLLASGRQTILPPTLHATTGQPYVWTTEDTLENLPVSDLPVVSADVAQKLAEALTPFGYVPPALHTAAGHGEIDAHSPHRSLNDAALENLDAWVPPLQLYGCHKSGAVYRAVAHWRPSSSGRPVTQRATNLSISPQGVRDFGDADRTYTPLDLVMAACGTDLDTAFKWLQERVAPQTPIILNLTKPKESALPRTDNVVVLSERQAGTANLSAQGSYKDQSHIFKLEAFQLGDPTKIPRREWLYGTHLMRKEIGLTVSAGGMGKTSLLLTEAVALASGRPLLGVSVPRAIRVAVWNGEEPIDELRRRISGIMLHYGIKQEEIDGRLWIGSGNDLPITLAEEGKNGRVICEPQLEAIVWTIRELGFDALFIDPFASTHSVSENDNASIQKAATAWKMIAYRCNIAISLAHHTRKPIGNGTATTANDFRGADALVAKARDVRALNSMSKEEANQYGINANESMSYIWIGPGGKSNMSPKTNEKTFYKIISCGLGNGQSLNEPEDRVGVVTQWHPPKIDIRPDPEQLEALKTIMEKRTLWRAAPQSKGEDSIRYAVAEAFGWDMETNRFRINSQIKALTNNKTIERYECHCSRSRKLVPAYRFVTMNVDKGGPDTEE